jgi:hypothetical protein
MFLSLLLQFMVLDPFDDDNDDNDNDNDDVDNDDYDDTMILNDASIPIKNDERYCYYDIVDDDCRLMN